MASFQRDVDFGLGTRIKLHIKIVASARSGVQWVPQPERIAGKVRRETVSMIENGVLATVRESNR